jgi:hypothetical protein
MLVLFGFSVQGATITYPKNKGGTANLLTDVNALLILAIGSAIPSFEIKVKEEEIPGESYVQWYWRVTLGAAERAAAPRRAG